MDIRFYWVLKDLNFLFVYVERISDVFSKYHPLEILNQEDYTLFYSKLNVFKFNRFRKS